ncbi:MAG: HAD-IA family hydrolase [Bryobacteraceae bacterium]|nr:HAD-IA family hydrolase [Bryobacteraceae bacterium]
MELRSLMDPHYKLVIFDLDGTLIDSKLDLAHAVNATRTHMALGPLSHELIYSYVGNGAPVLIRRALGNEASQADVDAALEYFLSYYREHKLDYTVLYPGVRQSLDELRDAGVRMAVLTNKPFRISREILDGLGVGPHFFQVYGGNSFEQKKPDPVGIHALLVESGISALEAMMVGDSGVDIQTARNAGIAAVGCSWGFQPESLLIDTPDYLIENMTELAGIVRSPSTVRLDAII